MNGKTSKQSIYRYTVVQSYAILLTVQPFIYIMFFNYRCYICWFLESMAVAGSASLPASPATPVTPGSGRKVDVWRSVFHPASNVTTREIGANVFDKPSHPNSPTVYDW